MLDKEGKGFALVIDYSKVYKNSQFKTCNTGGRPKTTHACISHNLT